MLDLVASSGEVADCNQLCTPSPTLYNSYCQKGKRLSLVPVFGLSILGYCKKKKNTKKLKPKTYSEATGKNSLSFSLFFTRKHKFECCITVILQWFGLCFSVFSLFF